MILLVGKNRSHLQVYHIHNMSCQLITVEIFIVFLQIHIIPDDILCSEKISVFQIIFLNIQCGDMVSVHDQDCRFIQLRKFIGQFLYELIHLINLVDIVFILPFQFFCRSRKHFARIFSVALHGDRIDHIPSLGRIECVQDTSGQNVIFRPVFRRFRHIFHIFQTGKGIKSHIGKHCIPVVEYCPVIMDRMGCISNTVQVVCKTFSGLFSQD